LYTDEIRDELSERNERIANEITDTISVIGDQIIQKIAKEEIMNSIDNLDGILDESVSVRLEVASLNNSTVHALHFAQLVLVNSLDSNYKHSFIIPDFFTFK
jgi:heptaprenylglyceryl phosphate synthase